MELIKVTKDLSTQEEISICHLVGKVFSGLWDKKEKGYLVTHEGVEYLVKQDEVESVEVQYGCKCKSACQY